MSSLKYIADVNLMTVTLTSAYTAASGSMNLTAGHGARLPSAGDFWLRTVSGTLRVFKVTARSTDTLTVVAAQDGTSDANLGAGTELKWVLGATAFDQFRQDLVPTGTDTSKSAEKAGKLYLPNDGIYLRRDTGAAWANWGPILPLTEPILTDFGTEIAVGTTPPTAAQSANGGILVTCPTSASPGVLGRFRSVPGSTPWRAQVAFLGFNSNITYDKFGINCRQTSDGQIVWFVIESDGATQNVTIQLRTNVYGFTATYQTNYSYRYFFSGAILYMAIRDNGTNRFYEVSLDGIVWKIIFVHGRTAGITADQVGFVAGGNSTYTNYSRVIHYRQDII